MKEGSLLLKGVIVPMITPFDENEDLDEVSVRKITRWLVEQGVQGVYPCSGCGEVWKLTVSERQKLIDLVLLESEGKVLVIPGTGGGSTREAVQLTKYARDKGADAVMVWPPYFMGEAYGEDAIFDHFETIARTVDIPMIVYDAPEIAGYSLSPELVARLAGIETVVGIKDSTGDLDKFAHQFQMTSHIIALLQGWDTLFLPALAMGSPGAILSAANVCPRILVDMYEDYQSGNIEAAREKHARVVRLVCSDPWLTDQFQSMKEALNMLGLPGGRVRKPWFSLPFTADQKMKLKAALKDLNLLN